MENYNYERNWHDLYRLKWRRWNAFCFNICFLITKWLDGSVRHSNTLNLKENDPRMLSSSLHLLMTSGTRQISTKLCTVVKKVHHLFITSLNWCFLLPVILEVSWWSCTKLADTLYWIIILSNCCVVILLYHITDHSTGFHLNIYSCFWYCSFVCFIVWQWHVRSIRCYL